MLQSNSPAKATLDWRSPRLFLRVMFQLDFRLFFNLLWLISYPPHLLIPRTFIVFTSQNRYAFSEWTSWAAMDGCTNDWEGMSHAKYSWVVLQKLLILFRSFIKTIRIRLRCIVSELWCHFMSAIRHGKGRHAVDPKGRVRDKKKTWPPGAIYDWEEEHLFQGYTFIRFLLTSTKTGILTLSNNNLTCHIFVNFIEFMAPLLLFQGGKSASRRFPDYFRS